MNYTRPELVLVTGASGAVGPRVVDALCSAGHTVRTFSLDRPHDGRQMTDARRRTDDGNTGSVERGAWGIDVETLIGDVTDPSAVQSAMQGVDAVIHLAALLHIVKHPAATSCAVVALATEAESRGASLRNPAKPKTPFLPVASHRAFWRRRVNPPPELRDKYERINVGGTATVVEAAILLMLS